MAITLFKRKNLLVPSLLGWLLILGLLAALFLLLFKNIYGFLAYEKPAASRVLVVEGWLPDNGLQEAIAHYKSNNYDYMILTGVPISQWTYSSPYSNMADASARSMKEMHFTDSIYTVHIPSTILRDRTYATAIALDLKWKSFGIQSDNFDLFTMGAHARRSALMFENVFGKRLKGVILSTDPTFEAEKWYKSSRGFRIVVSELISWFYAKLFFSGNPDEVKQLIADGYYMDEIRSERYENDRDFKKAETTPLPDSLLDDFRSLNYFAPDMNYRFEARFVVDTSAAPFEMATTTERKPMYRKYGTISFSKGDTAATLTAFQNLDILEKNPAYKGLFVPFKDRTNGKISYGGGRYLDIEIPESAQLILDFNKAYNPYCAYSSKWSCPIPPYENHLLISICAGVKKYH